MQLSSFPGTPEGSTLMHSVVPLTRSWTKRSCTPFVSLATRLVARLMNTTNRPSAERDIIALPSFASAPEESTLTRVVICAVAVAGSRTVSISAWSIEKRAVRSREEAVSSPRRDAAIAMLLSLGGRRAWQGAGRRTASGRRRPNRHRNPTQGAGSIPRSPLVDQLEHPLDRPILPGLQILRRKDRDLVVGRDAALFVVVVVGVEEDLVREAELPAVGEGATLD